MITGYPSIEGAVEAVKTGAWDYLVKPFTDDELLFAVKKALDKPSSRRHESTPGASFRRYGIIGESGPMKKVYRLIEKASATTVNALISGESGTGKELVARAIHYSGDRSSAPFVPVNCAAIPDNLLESELFGHVKGAFTDARESRDGFFKIADGGTVFLDEIGDASLNMQGKLLRVMENGEIYMVGSSQVQVVDARIIAATHKDLPNLLKKGHFREDLYYRLNVVDIPVPPLREREDDILNLAQFFVKKHSKEMDRPEPRFTDGALKALRNYRWPGNVRELENLAQRLIVLADSDVIDVTDMPSPMRFSLPDSKRIDRPLVDVEREHIVDVLKYVRGNKSAAAKILGIDRKTLRGKLKKIDQPR